MLHVMVRVNFEDYEKWKPVFDEVTNPGQDGGELMVPEASAFFAIKKRRMKH